MADIPTTSGANSSSRRSHYIKRKPASNLHHAIRVADRIDRPLNQLVTLNFAHTSCAPAIVSRQFGLLRESAFGPWVRRPPRALARHSAPPSFVWVIENAGGHTAVHWLVHIPSARLAEFRKRLPGWVKTFAGEIHSEAAAIHIEPAPTPKGAGRYMLKGIDPVFAEAYGVEHAAQGIVIGKRSGFSRNLGPTARKRIGYRPRPFQGLHPRRWATADPHDAV